MVSKYGPWWDPWNTCYVNCRSDMTEIMLQVAFNCIGVFNATFTARVISWWWRTCVSWLSLISTNTTFLSKATDYFSHMLLQRWEVKIRRKDSSPQLDIELTTTRSWVRHAHHYATQVGLASSTQHHSFNPSIRFKQHRFWYSHYPEYPPFIP